MTQLPTPQARRLRPATWKDSRLVLGVVLVLASVIVGALAFSAVDEREGVWVAAGEMTPGDRVGEDDLTRVEVQLDDDAAAYLRTEDGLPQDAVVDRPLRQGELVPRDALVDASSLTVSPVPVHVDPIYLTDLTKGSRVSVYTAVPASAAWEDPSEPDETSGEGSDPASSEGSDPAAGEAPTAATGAAAEEEIVYEKMLERVTVAGVPEPSGRVLGSESTDAVTILVPESQVQRLLTLDSEETPIKLVAERGAG